MKRGAFKRWAGVAAAVSAGLVTLEVQAQSGLEAGLTLTGEGALQLNWPVRSLVPEPGVQVFTDYQVFASGNLVEWAPVGEAVRGQDFAGESVVVLIPRSADWRFFKVQSLLDFSYSSFPVFSLQNANFAEADLFAADFFGADLSNASFEGADLQAADLSNTVLTEARFTGANLMGATLIASFLDDADCRGANLSFVNLSSASLNGADLAGADLRGSLLLGINMRYMRLQNTTINDLTHLDPRAEMIWKIVNNGAAGADLQNQDLSLSDLSDANLEGSDLRGSDLSGTDLVRVNLAGANLSTAELRFVDFRGSTTNELTQLPLKSRMAWQIVNSDNSARDFAGADLSSCFLPFTTASKASFNGANLRFSVLARADLREADLSNANCMEADLDGADLRRAKLTAANLTGANLSNANLEGADLTGAILAGTVFNNTILPDGTVR